MRMKQQSLEKFLEWGPIGCRSSGMSRKRWIETVDENLRSMGMGVIYDFNMAEKEYFFLNYV